MVRNIFFSTFLFLLTQSVFGQILCIQCYNQNNPVSTNITNLVSNGSFENSTCTFPGFFCPLSSSYNCDIQNWQCTGGGTGTYANLRDSTMNLVVNGGYVAYFGNLYCMACGQVADDTTCLVDSGCVVNGIPDGYPVNDQAYGGNTGVSLEQNVSGLTPGNVYVLEFWTGGEAGFQNDGLFAVDIGFGKTFLRNPMTYQMGTGRRFIIQFLADSSTHTIRFTNWGHMSGQSTELVLDDVRLYPVTQLSSIIPACAVGIQQADLTVDIRINQNELLHQIEIRSAKTGNYHVVLYNVTGVGVMSEKFSESITLDTRLLNTGIYVCEVSGKGVKKESKIVIR